MRNHSALQPKTPQISAWHFSIQAIELDDFCWERTERQQSRVELKARRRRGSTSVHPMRAMRPALVPLRLATLPAAPRHIAGEGHTRAAVCRGAAGVRADVRNAGGQSPDALHPC